MNRRELISQIVGAYANNGYLLAMVRAFYPLTYTAPSQDITRQTSIKIR